MREQTNDAPLLGASSAGEFTEAGAVKHGVAITAITGADMEFHTGLGTGLAADIETAASDAVSEMPDPQELDGHAVGINLHDGLLGRGDEVVLYAYQNQPMPYVGGSAGDDRQLEETAVFVDDAVATDAIGVGMLVADTAFGTAAAHGHDAVSGGCASQPQTARQSTSWTGSQRSTCGRTQSTSTSTRQMSESSPGEATDLPGC